MDRPADAARGIRAGGAGLRKKVFLRVFGLLALLIAAVCVTMSVFSLRDHRETTKSHFRAQAMFLADQAERLVLWDDRVALSALLSGLVDDQPMIAYAFVARDGRPYVHTFDKGVPKGLLNLHPSPGPSPDLSPSVAELESGEGRVYYDIAATVGARMAVLHLGLPRDVIDADARSEVLAIAVLGAMALAIGVLLAGVTATLTTREVNQMTEALRASEERFRAVMDNSPAAVHLKDMEGRYLLVNRRFEEWYRKPLQEIQGKTVYDFIAEDSADIFSALEREATETRSVRKCETEVLHPDGNRRTTMEIKFPILGSRGVPDGIGGITIDVTDRKQAEEERAQLQQQLYHSQKMEALGRLAGGVAHDFNNLLLPIILITEVLLGDVDPKSAEARHLGNVVEAAKRARKLVNQILAYSRPEADERQWLDLARVTSDAIDLLSSTIPSFIKVSRVIDTGVPPVFADPNQIHQVLMNLGMNASQAIGMKDGELKISLGGTVVETGRAVAHGRLNKGPYVVLTFADSGCGMDEAIRDRIFEPFFTTRIGTEGSGLGLAVVHRIVTDHGGAITVASTPGEGTTFEAYFPAGNHAAAAP
jgi:PAS domain S-box-containing protein